MLQRQRINHNQLIGGVVTLVLLGVIFDLSQSLDNNTVRFSVLALSGFIAIGVHYSIFKNGGFLPKNGRATVHSKIIFYCTVAGTVLSLAFLAALYFMYMI
ncbi:MAG: hypothetical protein IPM36_06055 [Lewinellaceae bacterium]|nr:hypothetical protein [Lewinellaceae bacterium]